MTDYRDEIDSDNTKNTYSSDLVTIKGETDSISSVKSVRSKPESEKENVKSKVADQYSDNDANRKSGKREERYLKTCTGGVHGHLNLTSLLQWVSHE